MKYRIITIHHIHNFGSVYQACSLFRFLSDHGYDAEIIDYRPPYYTNGRNKLKSLVGKALNYSSYRKRAKKFEAFIKKQEKLSAKVLHSPEELQEEYGASHDVFLTGGDQLWNDYHPCGKDAAYKLAFTKSPLKLAYGTSMGRDDYTPDELRTLANETKDFSCIMLREKSTVDLLHPYTEVPVIHAIDPVGLPDREWFRKTAVKPDISEPYAVMYLADSSPLLDEAIRLLREKCGLKIVHICGFHKKCQCDYFVKDAGPEEILGYLLHADFVLSASFHATMFSLLFNKTFATLLPGEKTNARIEDILHFVGLSDRIIKTQKNLSVIGSPIDFEAANAKIDQFRDDSRENLLNELKKMESERT